MCVYTLIHLLQHMVFYSYADTLSVIRQRKTPTQKDVPHAGTHMLLFRISLKLHWKLSYWSALKPMPALAIRKSGASQRPYHTRSISLCLHVVHITAHSLIDRNRNSLFIFCTFGCRVNVLLTLFSLNIVYGPHYLRCYHIVSCHAMYSDVSENKIFEFKCDKMNIS